MMGKILVAYASAHGSTAEVAEAIGKELRTGGHNVVVADVRTLADIKGYDAFVLGSAIHAGAFLPEMRVFLQTHKSIIGQKPVYVFVSCIRVLEKFGLEHVFEHYMMTEILEKCDVRSKTAFAGKLDLNTTDWNERWTLAARYDGSAWPSQFDGDFRNWEVIRAWAAAVQTDVKAVLATQKV
jgi:menaquinone-dependent protoporphyrinogen oxidase